MELQVKVFSNRSALDSDKRLFERIISIPFGVSVPFQSLIDDFKFLYGDSCVVMFRVL